jgi:peroxiredoxin Q/BCP
MRSANLVVLLGLSLRLFLGVFLVCPFFVCACNARSAAQPPATVETSAPAAVPPQADELLGKPAPDFVAPAMDGSTFSLRAARGKPAVVYFYPKDETPGCTKEACSFRDQWQAIAATGAVLVGVSSDDGASHRAFAAHYGLPFVLVTDADGSIGRTFGVPFERLHRRQTFVIGPDGVVRSVYRTVDVSTHSSQVLRDLQRIRVLSP